MGDDDRITGVFEITEELRAERPTVAQRPTDTPPATARLIVLEGATPGRAFTLGAEATLGRGTRAEVSLDDSLVSREHAVITRDEAGWMIRDLGSRNGTLLGGR